MSSDSMTTFICDGVSVEAEKGENLLGRLLSNGKKVPNLCFHPKLTCVGNCRSCLVELNGESELVLSCQTTIREGMEIITKSEKLDDARNWSMAFHLARHPMDCPQCEIAGNCKLQDEARNFESTTPFPFLENTNQSEKLDSLGSDLALNESRCTLCQLCTQFTKEVTKTNELGIMNYGKAAKVFASRPLDNNYTQNLVDLCPSGAIIDTSVKKPIKHWMLKEYQSICTGCEETCNIKVFCNEDGVQQVKPLDEQWICDDGRVEMKRFSSLSILKAPMKKDNDFYEVDYTEARQEISGKKVKFLIHTNLADKTINDFFNKLEKDSDVALFRQSSDEGFDGILKRENLNINTKGIEKAFEEYGKDASNEYLMSFLDNIKSSEVLFVVVPELLKNEKEFEKLFKNLKNSPLIIGLCVRDDYNFLNSFDYIFPFSSSLESDDSFIDYNDNLKELQSIGFKYRERPKSLVEYVNWGSR